MIKMKVVMKNTATFRALLQKISKNLPEAAINFAENKITFFGMDERGVIAGKLVIPKRYFKYYGYKQINNIAVNMNNLCSVLEELNENVTLALGKKNIILSAKKKALRKKFSIGIMKLGNRHTFPAWKPTVSWKPDEVIEDIKKISMKVDHGPLAIDSEQDGYKLSWIIAPTGGLTKKINIPAIRNYFRYCISSFRYNFINRPREAMLRLITVINDIDQQLRPIILWLNYNGFETFSCCTGHPLNASYKGKTYQLDGYISFYQTPKLAKLFGFLEKNGFEIVDNQGWDPVASIVFVKVKNGKVVRHYKKENKLDITQREVNIFWKNIFEQMRNLKEEI